MSKASGLTRGDRRRNARKARLRAMVPAANAVVGLDLGERKQALVVTGADGQVLARRSPRVGVHDLGGVLDWAAGQARSAGLGGVTVACEPTGSRWMVVQDLCERRGLPMVCVQPLVTHIAREQQDLTGDKTDEGDCVLIARLARELHCYVPEKLGGAWAELRAAGRDRAVQITRATAAKQLIRDQLGLVAPALLEAHCEPLDSATWLASLQVVLECGGLAAVAGMGYEQFAALVRERLGGWGGQRLGPAAARVFAAVPSAGAVTRMLRAAVRRISGALEDLKHARGRRERLEARMTGLLDELGIDHARICQIPGLTVAGLAAILAETGTCASTPRRPRWSSTPGCPRPATSPPPSTARPRCRGAAGPRCGWQYGGRPGRCCGTATWLAAKHAALTSREGTGKLTTAQAHVACAASLLRWIYALTVHGTRWDPAIAAGDLGHHHAMAA